MKGYERNFLSYLHYNSILISFSFQVKHEAKNSVDQLEALGSDGFEALFMNPCPFMRKFDQIYQYVIINSYYVKLFQLLVHGQKHPCIHFEELNPCGS